MTALLVDAIRRRWILNAYFTFMTWNLRSLFTGSHRLDDIGLALAAGLIIGSQWQSAFELREIRLLPVSRRTLWLARWWLTVGVGSLLATAAVSIGFRAARPDAWSWGELGLTLLYGVIFQSSLQWFFTTSVGQREGRPATKRTILAVPVVLLGMLAAPLLLSPYLPHRPADVGPITAVLLVAGLLLTIRGYQYSPVLKAWPAMRIARVPQPRSVPYVATKELRPEERAIRLNRHKQLPLWIRAPLFAAGVRPDIKQGPIADRLGGFRLLVWLEARRDLIACAVLLIFAAFVWSFGIITGDQHMVPWTRFLSTIGLLSFSHQAGAMADAMALGTFGFAMSMGMHGRINHVRLFRALPLSARQLASTFAALGCVSAAVIWTVLLLGQLLFAWRLPTSLRADLFFGAAALMTFLQGIRLASLGTRIPPPLPQTIGIGLPCALWYAAFTWPIGSPTVSMMLASLIVFAAGYFVLLAMITRANRLYWPALAPGFRG